MKNTILSRLLALVGLLAATSASLSLAAPGDKLLDAANPGLGQPNNLDPYFLDYNRAQGMAALSNGSVVVAWSERENTAAPVPSPDSPDGVNGKKDACFFRIYSATGTAVTAATRPYLDINSDGTGWQKLARVAALTGGGFVMTWNSVAGPGDTYDDTFGSGGDTWARVYDNSGTAVSGTFRVNDNDPNGVIDTQEPIAVVGLSGGGFAILWEDGNDNAAGLGATLSNTDDFFLRVFAANGTPAAASARLGGAGQDAFFKDYQAFGGAASGLVALSNNTVVVGWAVRDQNNDGTGVSADGTAPNGGGASYFQVFNASGAAVSSQTAPYLDINANASGSQLAPALAPLSGGGFAVVWNSNHNTDDGGNSDVGIGGNGTSGGDTYVRVYTNAGASTSSTVRVNDLRTGDTDVPSAIKPLTDGGFAIVWKDDEDNTGNTDDYFARAYNANGTPRNPSILIGGAAADALFEDIDANGHGMAALSDGGYAVAIRVRDSANNGTGTSLDGVAPNGGYSAAVRVFNADGTSRAGPFFPYGDINPDFSGNQNTPMLTSIAGGGFAVAWHSNQNSNDTDNDLPFIASTTSNGGDTYTRIFNNSGVALHGTVQAHGEGVAEPTGTIDQQDPFGIIGLTGGNYAIVIRDDNDNTNNKDDLFLTILEGVPVGGGAVAPTVTTATQSAVTHNSATLGGNVTADGGASVTERGIVWGLALNPTTADTKVANGSGTGAFSATVNGLPPNTLVHVRAYATNSVNTSYGTDISFNTLVAPVAVSSLNRVNTTPTNASTVNWTLTFASAVTGVTASNFSLTDPAATGSSVGTPTTGNAGLTWNIPVTTGTTDGLLTLNLANATGLSSAISNTLPFAGQSYTIDKTPPTVLSVTRLTPLNQTTNLTGVVFRVTYSEPVTLTAPATNRFQVVPVGGSTIVGTVTGVTGTGNTRDVTVNLTSGTGEFKLRVID